MDLVPTWIDVLDIPATQTTSGGVTGWSLVDLLRDVVGETERFSKRPLPLGRLIRSDDEWGVVLGQHKWTTSATQTQLFDVLKDPAERTNLNKTDSATHQDFPTLLAKGLNQTVTMAIRIAGPGRHRKMSGPGSAMVIQHPQGIAAAWTRIDARGEYAKPTIQEGVVTVPWIPNKETPREVFVTLPQGASPMGLHVSRATKDEVISGTVTVMSSADESVLLAIDETENGFTVGRTWQPIPTEDNHIEMRGDVDEELRALGYVE